MSTASHDEQWFERVFAEHGTAIVRFLYRRGAYSDAEDLAAEVFTVMWRKKAEVPDGAELPWLYKTAGLTLANWYRKKKSLPMGDNQESLDSTDFSDPAQLVVEDQGMRAALLSLSERDREIILAVAWEGLSGNALAQYLGVSRSAADAALSRARKRLEEAIENNTS
ncbi:MULTISPECIES: RNA polymerase sigma factor [Mobiluncus]|uniref:Sigma-70 region 2 n=3 Tax=Mobiluncus TaxID=2050 RepID=D6ZJ47_MOBCV|nr:MULTISPECIES: sigma-70 family RNA polymerase sigma factor [Mobiluncus]ADI66746.1 Sigma-70 region 2 [Mobiluncus curtisii ATCC 43063]EFL93238.1 Sigma-70 region 2 [Mobiluncus curtisii subsp. curtisii ATCC 35241]EFU82717.1 Sigma-70 region 2 [Mobiluncus holmesii ATCC 35242]MCU9986762.1 sigma-70 family RNA polymerase sigma factor [Mobiluncus curtisii]MCU9999663.1 sigma-70 family RNA polymerase sigma factor [Mobiluncus curtisii]